MGLSKVWAKVEGVEVVEGLGWGSEGGGRWGCVLEF